MNDERSPSVGFGKGVNDYLNTYVALADAKAAGFLAAGLTVGAAVLNIGTISLPAATMRWLSIVSLSGSICVSAFVIFPRLPSGRRGLVFWEDIRTRAEFEEYQREAAQLTDADVEAEYAAQNYFVSDVVHGKHYWVRWAILLFLLGIGFGAGAYLLN